MDRGGTDNALFTALNAYNKPTINCRDYPQSRGGCVVYCMVESLKLNRSMVDGSLV